MNHDLKTKEACLKHIEKYDLLGFSKINMFSIAALMGKARCLNLAAARFDMWADLNGQTLIQLCNKSNDTYSVEVCLSKIAEGQASFNW